jgi:Secretion system C-terminal sorting domain
MKATLTMMIVLMLALSAPAQVTEKWEQQMDGQYTSERYSGSCPDGEGGVITVGQQFNTDTGKSEAIYARFNEQGELLWEGVYSGGNTYSRGFEDIAPMYPYPNLFLAVGSSTINNDTHFLMTVITLDGNTSTSAGWDFGGGGWLNKIELTTFGLVACGTTELDNGLQQGIIIALNDPLDIEWWQTYGDYDRNFLDDIKLSGSNYIATGWGWTGDDRAPWVLKVDWDGTQEWSQYFPAYDGAYPASIVHSTGSDMMIAGYSLLSGNSQYWVMRVDQSGNEVWSQEYGAVDGHENGKWIGQSSLGGYWVLGDGISPSSDGYDIWAIRIDENGALIDSDIFNQGGDQTMWKGAAMNDDEFAIVGYHNDGNPSQKSLISYYTPTQDLEIFIDPTNWPFTIPYTGGGFLYEAFAYNHTNSPMTLDAWMIVEHVYSEVTVQVRLFEDVVIPANGSAGALLQQYIPQAAPSGEFRYTLFVGDHPWQSQASDWFTFWKSGPVLTSENDFGDVFEQPELWPLTGGFGLNEEVFTASEPAVVREFSLSPAFPNPFNPTTTISVSLPNAADLSVTVFNALGQQIAELANGSYAAGSHALVLDGSDLASGIYFVHASVPGQLNAVQKIVLMK